VKYKKRRIGTQEKIKWLEQYLFFNVVKANTFANVQWAMNKIQKTKTKTKQMIQRNKKTSSVTNNVTLGIYQP
jgi:hypothetical protein